MLVLAPVVPILYQSVRDQPLYAAGGAFTLSNYVHLFTEAEFGTIILNTLLFALLTTAFALAIAVPMAILLERTRFPAARVLGQVLRWPIYISPLVLAFGWIVVYGPAGFLTTAMREGMGWVPWNLYSMTGMAFVEAVAQVPIAYLFCANALAASDTSLENAARSVGAGPIRILRSVVIPMLRPPVLYAGLLIFGTAVETLSIPLILGEPAEITMFSSFLYEQGIDAVSPDYGLLGAASRLAKAYADSAKALAEVDDNPVIRWQHRVWCETGYRSPGDAGTGQPVDQLVDPAKDFVSPKGFLHRNHVRPMPAGGVRFLDNAWYFGTDFTGLVIARTPDGLIMLDALTTPDDMRTQFVDQAAAAGLDPRDIRYVFLGHHHVDHVGGANLIRDEYAPRARFVMGQPDAAVIAAQRADLKKRKDEYTEEEYRARLARLPRRIDIEVEAYPGHTAGMQRIRTGRRTTAVAMLAPGHTVGQMHVIVPVVHQGETHKLLVWSGNDNIEAAAQYAVSPTSSRVSPLRRARTPSSTRTPTREPCSVICGRSRPTRRHPTRYSWAAPGCNATSRSSQTAASGSTAAP